MYYLGILLIFFLSIKPMYSELNVVHIEQQQYEKVLTTKAKPVSFPLSSEDKNLIKEMQEKLVQLGGVGLAAPQVNQPKQILVINISEEAAFLRKSAKPYSMHVMINPSYEPTSNQAKHADFEACYSVKYKAGKVLRFKEIKLSFYDEAGIFHESIEQGFYARVIQHEIDHLNGILIINRLTRDCTQGTLEEMMQLRRSEFSKEQQEVFDRSLQKKARETSK